MRDETSSTGGAEREEAIGKVLSGTDIEVRGEPRERLTGTLTNVDERGHLVPEVSLPSRVERLVEVGRSSINSTR